MTRNDQGGWVRYQVSIQDLPSIGLGRLWPSLVSHQHPGEEECFSRSTRISPCRAELIKCVCGYGGAGIGLIIFITIMRM